MFTVCCSCSPPDQDCGQAGCLCVGTTVWFREVSLLLFDLCKQAHHFRCLPVMDFSPSVFLAIIWPFAGMRGSGFALRLEHVIRCGIFLVNITAQLKILFIGPWPGGIITARGTQWWTTYILREVSFSHTEKIIGCKGACFNSSIFKAWVNVYSQNTFFKSQSFVMGMLLCKPWHECTLKTGATHNMSVGVLK